MQNLNEIRTANWVLRLPADWRAQHDQHDQRQGFHFASGDASKALFIVTHVVGPEHPLSLPALAEWFVGAEMATLAAMQGYLWRTCARSVEGTPTLCVGLLDSVAPDQHCRIIGKILVRARQVVRASFHDYHCHNYAASQAYFAPILAALDFVQESPGRAGALLH